MEDFNQLLILLSGDTNTKVAIDAITKFIEKFGIDYQGEEDSEAPEATLLHIACKHKKADIVAFLMHRGANPTIIDGNGDNAYMLAVKNNDASTMQQLLSYHADRSGLYVIDPDLITTAALTCNNTMLKVILFTNKHYKSVEAMSATTRAITRLSAEPALNSQQESALYILNNALEIVEISKTTPKEINVESIDTPTRLNPTRTERQTISLMAATTGHKIHFAPYEEPESIVITQPASAKKMRVEEKEKE